LGGRAKSAIPAVSLYDALVKLLKQFDSAGRTEILRLLIERRFTAPIFIPSMNKQGNTLFAALPLHQNAIRHLSWNGQGTAPSDGHIVPQSIRHPNK
jgi:hypothetical protein